MISQKVLSKVLVVSRSSKVLIAYRSMKELDFEFVENFGLTPVWGENCLIIVAS